MIALGAAVLVAGDMAAWLLWVLWHLLPFLLAMAGGVVLVWAPVLRRRSPNVIQGHAEATEPEHFDGQSGVRPLWSVSRSAA